VKVARLYRFTARHFLPGVAGYDQPHEHDYTIEVVAKGGWHTDAHLGMVVDTAQMDKVWKGQPTLDGRDLNEVFDFATTVENLAFHFHRQFRAIACPVLVRVWEDNDLWGEAP
jgi:6-pyruvoyl-tetrahydropterin synthase